jgi:hypothetical protein
MRILLARHGVSQWRANRMRMRARGPGGRKFPRFVHIL